MYQDIDIFQEGGPAEKDLLDRAVEGYEENVPLLAQIVAGFTPPGMAMDVAAAGKYGRDAFRDFGAGNVGEGLLNLGIAGLSGLAAVPLYGEAANLLKQPLKAGLKSDKGILALPDPDPRRTLTRAQADLYTGDVAQDALNMHQRALRLGPEFNQQIDSIADELGLTTILPGTTRTIDDLTGSPVGTVKMPERIAEKAATKTGGDVTNISDPIRTRIVINTPAEEEAVAAAIAKQFKVFDKGRDIKPEGFVDRKLNIQFTGANGETLIGEVGIITAPMWRASDKGHVYYEEFRSLFPKGMPTDPTELNAINRSVRIKGENLLKEMDQIFKEAKDRIDPSFYDVAGSSKKGIANLDVTSKDLLEEFYLRGGAKIDSQNNVTLYHRTNKESADKIRQTGKMIGKEDRLYFSTKPSGAIKGYGDELVEVKIPIQNLNIEDIFSDEVHVTLKSNFKPTDVDVKKFASGGYVTAGSSGRSLPIAPNFVSKSVLDIFEPSTKKSATWLGSASVQSVLPGEMKNPKSPSPTGSNTAGPSSHVKYNLSITPSLQKFTNNYNPNEVDIFEVE